MNKIFKKKKKKIMEVLWANFLVSCLWLCGTWVDKLYCRAQTEIIQALFARAWGPWELSYTEVMVIVENYFLFADYFALWFCFPQGESHLDKISVNSHVVIHVNSFTECVLRRASREEKWEMCRCLTVSVVPRLTLFSWSVQMLYLLPKC